MSSIQFVRIFHERFEQPINDTPYVEDNALNELRVKLIREETKELEDALAARDVVEVLDALTDLQYVLDGAYLSLGFERYKEAATFEVHRSNMSKLGADGKPVKREDGKVIKGPGFFEPDLESVIWNIDTWWEG